MNFIKLTSVTTLCLSAMLFQSVQAQDSINFNEFSRTELITKSNHRMITDTKNPLRVKLISQQRIENNEALYEVSFLGFNDNKIALVRDDQNNIFPVKLEEVAVEVDSHFPLFIQKGSRVFEKHNQRQTGTVSKLYSNGFVKYRRDWSLTTQLVAIDRLATIEQWRE
jgi:hypothetical protein